MTDSVSVPSGTVTFLFSDIEASTQRWQMDRAAMADALAVHDTTLADLVDGAGGHVFKHTGDGICAVFASARGAIDVALAAQEVLALPVRIGLHTGEADQRDGDYFGPSLNRCARIMDAGHGGQTLASAATVGLLEGVDVRDLGEHELKGLAIGERIFQIGQGDFAALRVQGSNSLPRSRTSFVGRESLVTSVVDQLNATQLITLVGFGGVGKTRAAIASAERLVSSFERTVFVDLGVATDEADVLPTVARALGVPSPNLTAVTMSVSSTTTLLVIDNCEHVLDEAAEVVEAILESSTTTRVLATSREALAIEGEVLIPVTGLAGDGADSPAVQLFVDRARAVAADFELDDEGRLAVRELCDRLDHTPLAIELAAARVATMSPAELVGRLDDRFSVLTGGRRRRRRDRHQTLRQAIDWSYDLLDGDERRVFARLAAFGGEFDLAAASALNPDLGEVEVVDVLAALVDKSMLTVVRTGSVTNYRFLETIRAYAEELLEAGSEHDTVMGHLHDHLVAFIAAVGNDFWTGRAFDSLRRLRDQTPNLRRALDTALDHNDVTAAAELVAPRAKLLTVANQGFQGWADEILALPGAADHPSRQALLSIRAYEYHYAGNWRMVRAAADDALSAAEPDQTPWWALWIASFLTMVGGDQPEALRLARRAVETAGAVGPDEALLSRLAVDMVVLADTEATLAAANEIGIDVGLGCVHPSPVVVGYAEWNRAMLALSRQDYETMLSAARAILQIATDDDHIVLPALVYQGWGQVGLGQNTAAVKTADSLLEFGYRWGMPSEFLGAIAIYALTLQAIDEPTSAAVLRGWLPATLTFIFTDEVRALDDWLRAVLSAAELDELKSRGRGSEPRDLQHLVHRVLGSDGSSD